MQKCVDRDDHCVFSLEDHLIILTQIGASAQHVRCILPSSLGRKLMNNRNWPCTKSAGTIDECCFFDPT
jgi:hypothetical protein